MGRTVRAFGMAFAVMAVMLAPGASGQNLINNPGMEQGDPDPDLWFSGNVFADSDDPELTRTWTTEVSNSGARSVEIDDRSEAGIAEWRSGGVPMEGGRAYLFSWFWQLVSISGGDELGASITIAWFDGLPDEAGNAGGAFLKQDVYFTGSDPIPDFSKVAVVLTAPDDAQSVDMRLRSGSGFGVGGSQTTCLVRLDDTEISALDTSGTNLISNPDLELGADAPDLWFYGNVFVGLDDPELTGSWQTEEFNSPDHALQIDDLSVAGIGEWRSGGVPVEEGVEYTFAWWWQVLEPAGGDGLGASITIAWFAGAPDDAGNASGAFIGQNVVLSGGADIDPFAQAGAVLVAPAGAQSVDVRLRSGSGFAAEGAATIVLVRLDDVFIGRDQPTAVSEWMLLY